MKHTERETEVGEKKSYTYQILCNFYAKNCKMG